MYHKQKNVVRLTTTSCARIMHNKLVARIPYTQKASDDDAHQLIGAYIVSDE